MVKKAVIPAAGWGTRFLPATKAQPKEMLPIIDTPTIQYVVQEAIESGIEDILIISGRGKRAIEDHFDRNIELELRLSAKNNNDDFQQIKNLGEMANIHFIRQTDAKGLGDALKYARQHVGNEPFAVLLGDTIIDSVIPVTQQIIDIFEQYQETVVAVEEVPIDKVSRYGIIGGEQVGQTLWKISHMIEKPEPEKSPGNLAFAGRYILTPDIFEAIDQTKPGKNNEIQLTDAMQIIIQKQDIYACLIEGIRYDIGSKMDYLKTIIEYGLKRKEFSSEFLEFLKEIIKKQSKY
jgi:UTP--glucose-1-phosphate uridylyltransferase